VLATINQPLFESFNSLLKKKIMILNPEYILLNALSCSTFLTFLLFLSILLILSKNIGEAASTPSLLPAQGKYVFFLYLIFFFWC